MCSKLVHATEWRAFELHQNRVLEIIDNDHVLLN